MTLPITLALALASGCREDTTHDLTFACHSDNDCAAGYVCDPQRDLCARAESVPDVTSGADTTEPETTEPDISETDTSPSTDTTSDVETPPPPTLSGIEPARAYAGAGSVMLTISGSGFTASSVVEADGSALATTFGDTSNLTATLPSMITAGRGAVSLTVHDGAVSNAVTFVVDPVLIVADVGGGTVSHVTEPVGNAETSELAFDAVPIDVAITPSGHLLVLDGERQTVDEYTVNGALVRRALATPVSNASSLAVDSQGAIYLVGDPGVERFDGDGQPLAWSAPEGEIKAIAFYSDDRMLAARWVPEGDGLIGVLSILDNEGHVLVAEFGHGLGINLFGSFAIDADDNAYFASYDLVRVAADGETVTRLVQPVDDGPYYNVAAVTGSGVTRAIAARVFDTDGSSQIRFFTASGQPRAGIGSHVWSVRTDGQSGFLLVDDEPRWTGATVRAFALDGAPVRTLATGLHPAIYAGVAVAARDRGSVFVASGPVEVSGDGPNRLRALGTSGAIVFNKALAAGDLFQLVATASARAFVRGDDDVLAYDADGAALPAAGFHLPDQHNDTQTLAPGNDGTLLVCSNGVIARYSNDGDELADAFIVLDEFECPSASAEGPDHDIYLLRGDRISHYGESGQTLDADYITGLRSPVGLVRDAGGDIYVWSFQSSGYGLVHYGPTGTQVGTRPDVGPVRPTSMVLR